MSINRFNKLKGFFCIVVVFIGLFLATMPAAADEYLQPTEQEKARAVKTRALAIEKFKLLPAASWDDIGRYAIDMQRESMCRALAEKSQQFAVCGWDDIQLIAAAKLHPLAQHGPITMDEAAQITVDASAMVEEKAKQMSRECGYTVDPHPQWEKLFLCVASKQREAQRIELKLPPGTDTGIIMARLFFKAQEQGDNPPDLLSGK